VGVSLVDGLRCRVMGGVWDEDQCFPFILQADSNVLDGAKQLSVEPNVHIYPV
jgi:hypothetical protein